MTIENIPAFEKKEFEIFYCKSFSLRKLHAARMNFKMRIIISLPSKFMTKTQICFSAS